MLTALKTSRATGWSARDALVMPAQFDRLALADSLSLDAYKWHYQPIDCRCLLNRDALRSESLFEQRRLSPYLQRSPVESFDVVEESFELSPRQR